MAGLRDGGRAPARRRGLRDLGRWPFRVGICAGLAVLTGLAALLQRDVLAPPQWGVIVLVTIAVLPWLVDLLVATPPPWAFAAAVVVPVAALHQAPARDPLLLLLAILALDLGLQAGVGRSLVVLVPGLAVALGPVLVTVGITRWLGAVLVAVAGAWLVGLALHSQVVRIAALHERVRHLEIELAAARDEQPTTSPDDQEEPMHRRLQR